MSRLSAFPSYRVLTGELFYCGSNKRGHTPESLCTSKGSAFPRFFKGYLIAEEDARAEVLHHGGKQAVYTVSLAGNFMDLTSLDAVVRASAGFLPVLEYALRKPETDSSAYKGLEDSLAYLASSLERNSEGDLCFRKNVNFFQKGLDPVFEGNEDLFMDYLRSAFVTNGFVSLDPRGNEYWVPFTPSLILIQDTPLPDSGEWKGFL
jgi:hypothetical protein